jgi:oxygen-independent coproporphyrinogen-3 oxidase
LETGARSWEGPFGSLYLGGGSPSSLDAASIAAVFKILERFILSPGAEVTIEANPQDATGEMIRLWRDLGVTRISLGVQSFDARGLKEALGRLHGASEAFAAAEAVSRSGAELSLDLIYGWNGQSLADWERDLRLAVNLSPGHVSAYCLTPAPGTRLAEMLASGEMPPLPDEGLLAEMFLAAGVILETAGIRRYEVSNFARQGRECQHNLRYWRRTPYLGLGPSAHSFDLATRRGNLASLSGWARALREGGSPLAFSEAIGPREARLETIMLGLRLSEGLEAGELATEPALEEFVRDGYIFREGGRLVPTEKGMLHADYLARRLA